MTTTITQGAPGICTTTWAAPDPSTQRPGLGSPESRTCDQCRHLTAGGECSRIWSGPHGPAQGDPVVIQSGQMLAVLWIREPDRFGCRLWESKLRSVS